jgi:hypothetical protein
MDALMAWGIVVLVSVATEAANATPPRKVK